MDLRGALTDTGIQKGYGEGAPSPEYLKLPPIFAYIKKMFRGIIILILLSVAKCVYSQPLEICKPHLDSLSIGRFVLQWEGTPYKYGGTSAKGIDCSALTQKAYLELFGVKIPRTAISQFKALLEVKVPQPGDLVFFKSLSSPSGWHVGIWLWDNLFLHAANRKTGVTVSSFLEGTYKERVLGWRRLCEEALTNLE